MYKTRLDPPPANGWIPPALPPLEDLLAANSAVSEVSAKKRNEVKVGGAPQVSGGTAAMAPLMANLFEESPDTLFDADEDDVPEPEPVPEPPKPPNPVGPIVVNGQAAQLIERKALDATRTQYRVILDSTGELKSFISPPANVEGT